MKAAIYARYSTENQKETSIEDQVASCLKYASVHNYTISDDFIYTDYDTSGSTDDRIGLKKMQLDAANSKFGKVLVDDFSRLSRNNIGFLTTIETLGFNGLGVISVTENIDTSDPTSKFYVHIKGVINETYLDDLKQKTLRGQLGQLRRGYSAGATVYGYKSYPSGNTRVDKSGRPRPEGYRTKIEEDEAKIVTRIFNEFANGKSINAIMKLLNRESVETKKPNGIWRSATIKGILSNKKYIGVWSWGVTETKRVPGTGKIRQVARFDGPLFTAEYEELRIIPNELWIKVQSRLLEVKKVWPGGTRRKGFQTQQGSSVLVFPTELLSGAMRCSECGGTIGKITARHGGYYGCTRAKLKGCSNNIWVRKDLVEKIILSDIDKKMSETKYIMQIFTEVERKIKVLTNTIPDDVKIKRNELGKLKSKVDNLINFIALGDSSPTVREALTGYESSLNKLNIELMLLEETMQNAFKAPPIEWIKERVANIKEILELKTEQSALLLRNLLGEIVLEPVRTDLEKPYLKAVSKFRVWTLLEKKEMAPEKGPSSLEPLGSNSYNWRTVANALRTYNR